MGTRGFIIVKLNKTLNENDLWELTKQYEAIDGIDFASNVIGQYDFVLSVDTKDLFENIIDKIKKTDSSGEVLSLKINNVYDKHREIKDLKILNDLL